MVPAFGKLGDKSPNSLSVRLVLFFSSLGTNVPRIYCAYDQFPNLHPLKYRPLFRRSASPAVFAVNCLLPIRYLDAAFFRFFKRHVSTRSALAVFNLELDPFLPQMTSLAVVSRHYAFAQRFPEGAKASPF